MSLKAAPAALLPNRGRVVAVGVERRIKVDQVNGLAIQAPEYIQVVAPSRWSCLQSWERSWLGYQLFIGHALAVRSLRHESHLLASVQGAAVVATLKFGNVPA